MVVPQWPCRLEAEFCTFADEESETLSPRIRLLVEGLRREWPSLDERIAALKRRLCVWLLMTRQHGV
jgi:hypothetical protein